MNINEMRNAVLQGLISTVTAQNFVYSVYDERTEEDSSAVRTENSTQIADYAEMFR